jgi:hypothetical protein
VDAAARLVTEYRPEREPQPPRSVAEPSRAERVRRRESVEEDPDHPATPDRPVGPIRRPETEDASPILGEREIGPLRPVPRLPARHARVAVVAVTSRGGFLVFDEDRWPSPAELLRRRVRHVCEIDMGQHHTQWSIDLPSHEDTFGFHAVVDMCWQVEDPILVTRNGTRNVRRALAPHLLRQLRAITRRHDVERPESAEQAANELLSRRDVGAAFGFRTTTLVQLAMDDAIRQSRALRSRVAAYRKILGDGDLNQFALQLAENPNEVSEVVRTLLEQRDSHRTALVEFVTQLVDSGAIDRWEIDDQVRTVLQWLGENTRTVITGNDDSRRVNLGEPHTTLTADATPITPV